MNVPDWKDRREFEAWWRAHGREFRLLSVRTPPKGAEVTDPEWLRIAAKIEAFNERCPA